MVKSQLDHIAAKWDVDHSGYINVSYELGGCNIRGSLSIAIMQLKSLILPLLEKVPYACWHSYDRGQHTVRYASPMGLASEWIDAVDRTTCSPLTENRTRNP